MKAELQAKTGLLIHSCKIPVKGVKRKVIYHFGDTHLSEAEPSMQESDRAYAIRRNLEWQKARLYYVSEYNEPCHSAQLKDAPTHFLNLVAQAQTGDAFVMTGDICECVNAANMAFIEKALSGIKTPFLSVAGNHENPDSILVTHPLADMKKPISVLKLDDITIVGINNSKREITKEQNEELLDLLKKENNIIIVMHTPIITAENEKSIKKVEDYFKLNHQNATAETDRFIEIIKEGSQKIIAIFAGHLHFKNNSEIVGGLTQYVVGQGLLGNINRYEIGE